MRSSILNQHIQLPSEAESFIQSASPFWKPDESTDSCERCFKKFSFTVRRHHCRDCGGIFCSDCTPHRVQLVYRPALNGNGTQQDPKEKKRICTYCWGFIDMHQKQEHDRMNEARRMQLRAQDEGFMRRMAEGTSGVTMQCLRKHMEKELLGRNRARFGPRSVAATSTKWSNSDEDADDDNGGQDWKVSKLDHLPDSITKKNEDLCFRDNLVDTKRQWQTSVKKQQQNALKDALSGAIPKLPVPPLGLFLELSDKCGVNLTVDANSSAGQNVLAANQTSRGVEHYYHKVTDDNLMEENSLVGVAAYFRT